MGEDQLPDHVIALQLGARMFLEVVEQLGGLLIGDILGDAATLHELAEDIVGNDRVLDDVVGPPLGSASFTDKKAYLHMLVLKDCDFDLEKVAAKMRDLYPSRGTNFKKVMEPYKMMMEQMGMTEGQDYWKTIRDQLT